MHTIVLTGQPMNRTCSFIIAVVAGRRVQDGVQFCFRVLHPSDPHPGFYLQAKCHIENINFSFVIEFSDMRSMKDDFMVLFNSSGCQPSAKKPVIPTKFTSTRQFLLAEFFADPRPDLIILFGNAHDSMRLHHLSRCINDFVKLIDRYVTAIPPTRFMWLSKIAEGKRKPEKWRRRRYEGGKMTRLEWLDAANRIMYSKMRRRFLNMNSFLLFPDLFQMSLPVLDDYDVDGVHMRPDWYQHVWSYIIQTTCSEA